MNRLTDVLRGRLRESADRLVARALGQQWQPLRPTPPRERFAARSSAPRARHEAVPIDVEVEAPVSGSALLDIREPGELAQGVADGALCVPMDAVPHTLERLRAVGPVTVYCAAGARSFGVAHWLREQGVEAWSLVGGLGAVRAEHPVITREGAGVRVRLPRTFRIQEVALGAEVDAEVVGPAPGGGREVVFRDAAGFQVLAVVPDPR
jgi:rhodanese-related sulfurtransferase